VGLRKSRSVGIFPPVNKTAHTVPPEPVVKSFPLEEVLAESLGVNPKFFSDMKNDDDWAFVIKSHALIEAALNHAITSHLGDERLTEIIAYSDISDRRKGKLAFIQALDILPSEMRGFIQQMSEIRNAFVHDVRNLGFRLADWIENMTKEDKAKLRKNQRAMFPDKLSVYGKQVIAEEFILSQPRLSVSLCVMLVVLNACRKGAKLSGVKTGESFQVQIGSRTETRQPKPKESK